MKMTNEQARSNSAGNDVVIPGANPTFIDNGVAKAMSSNTFSNEKTKSIMTHNTKGIAKKM